MSDQDFFFDEEEAPKAKGEAEKKASSPGKKAPAGKAPSAPAASLADQTVTMTVAALIAAIALLGGVIVGILLPIGGSSNSGVGGIPVTNTGAQAPQLTPEQLNSGELPAGHPQIGGGAGGSGAATSTK